MATKMRHTPGPWLYETTVCEPGACTHEGHYEVVTAPNSLLGASVALIYGRVSATNEANARLIAAAPELAIALREAFENFDSTVRGGRPVHNELDWAKRARALLAKLDG